MKHLKLQFKIIPLEDAIVHTHWSDHLKLSTRTNCQKVALSHIPLQNIRLLDEFHWDEPKHLRLLFEINFVLLALCFTPDQNASWLYQKTHTQKKKVFIFLSQITKSSQRFPELGQLKLWNCKSSEVSRDVLGYLLACMHQPDDPQYAIIPRNKKSVARYN